MQPPRIVLYGPSKIGISTFCSKIPDVYFLDVGRTIGHLSPNGQRCSLYKGCESEDGVEEIVSKIKSREIYCKTLVIDNLYGLEKIIMNAVFADEQEKKSPGIQYFDDIPYGRGPGMVIEKFSNFLSTLDGLVSDGIGIVITAQEFIEQRNMAHGPVTFSRPNMITKATKAQTISEEAYTVLTNWADCTLYASLENQVSGQFFASKNYDTLNKDPQDRCIYTERRPSFEAGNRYGLPYKLPFEWEQLNEGIQNYFIKKRNTNNNNTLEEKDEKYID
jgi:hypothetical protein